MIDNKRNKNFKIKKNPTKFYWDSPCKNDNECPFYKKKG